MGFPDSSAVRNLPANAGVTGDTGSILGLKSYPGGENGNSLQGCNLKNGRMISVCFQGKPFNITVIEAYAPTSNAEEAEGEWFYEDLQDLLELTPPKRRPFHYRGLECKSRKSRNIWSNRQIWSWSTE